MLVPLLALLAAGACGSATRRCGYEFEARVVQGPDLGTTLAGRLALEINPAGSLNGVLVGNDGTQINVVGQATGRAVNLVFDLGGGLNVFGVGTAQQPVDACQGVMGGPFAGPHPGSTGDWIARATR